MPSSQTITSFNTFTGKTLIRSGQVNDNFSIFRGHILPVNTDTATSSDSVHDLGAVDHRWMNIYGNVAVLTGQSTPAANPTTGMYKVYMKSDGIMYRLNSGGGEAQVTTGVPLTTKGDLAVHDGSTTVRFPIGTNGQILIADSSATSGMRWSAQGSSSYRSVTTTDTCTTSDDILELSGASFTETLFTAVGNTGKELTIKHGGTSFTQVYTIDGNGAETIDGTATVALNTNGETLKIVSNGSNWTVLDHKPNKYLGALTTTGSWSTNTTYAGKYWREGDSLVGDISVATSGAPTSATLTITLPSSLTMDTAKLASISTTHPLGYGRLLDSGAANWPVYVFYASSTTIQLTVPNGTGDTRMSTGITQAVPMTWAAGDELIIRIKVPISGWYI